MSVAIYNGPEMLNFVRIFLNSIAPHYGGADFDHIAHRWMKLTACITGAVGTTALLAATLQVLDERGGAEELIEWLDPVVLAILVWRFAGWAWLYWTLRHAPWSWEHAKIWWRATSSRRP